MLDYHRRPNAYRGLLAIPGTATVKVAGHLGLCNHTLTQQVGWLVGLPSPSAPKKKTALLISVAVIIGVCADLSVLSRHGVSSA